jgi:hypothetical protein
MAQGETFEVVLPSGLVIEGVPAGLTDEQIKAQAIKQGIAMPDDFVTNKTLAARGTGMRDADYSAYANTRPANQNFVAGIGGTAVGLGLEAGKMLGLTDQAAVDRHMAQMRGLTSAPGGGAGSVAGYAHVGVPTLAIPGANTYAGAGLFGGLLGLTTPSSTAEEKAINTGLGVAGAVGGKAAGDLIGAGARYWGDRRQAARAAAEQANRIKDQTQKAAIDAGYTVPPSYAGGGRTARVAEGVSGKYKTNQLAGIRNQQVTNRLARQSVGMAPDEAMTPSGFQAIRNDAFNTGYEPIRRVGRINADSRYKVDMDIIKSRYTGAKRSFPASKTSDVEDVVKQIDVDGFDASDALDQIQIMRDQSSLAYRNGDKALGKAYRDAARAIEDRIERHLKAQGADSAEMLKAFRESRVKMAKTHSLEKALIESTGDVDATKLVKDSAKLTGEQKTIAESAQAYRDVMRVPKSGDANPFTVLDAFGGGMAGMGAYATDLPPWLAFAFPLARVGARNAVLSRPVQAAMANKSYGPGLLGAYPSILPGIGNAAQRGMMGALPGAMIQEFQQ